MRSQGGEGETGCSGVEGGKPDGVPVKEELLRGILAKRKSRAGLKCCKNQASSPARPYVLSAFVLGISCDVRCCQERAEGVRAVQSPRLTLCIGAGGEMLGWACKRPTFPPPVLLGHRIKFIRGLFTLCEKWSSLLCTQQGFSG